VPTFFFEEETIMAKTYNNLYEQICSFDNIYCAYLKARKNKRYKSAVLKFTYNLEENLINIREELINKLYKTGQYRHFNVHEPKTRKISALPFKDRVVQHAICNVIEPIFEKSFIYDSHACRKEFGVISGVSRTNKFIRKVSYNSENVYCLKCDISKYFLNIDHRILKKIIRKKIKCKDTLFILDGIIDSFGGECGIPIGNLTSQLFANIYLNEFDHYIKNILRIKHYIRYMDDFIILSDNKKDLKSILKLIIIFLDNKRKLKLNKKSQIFLINKKRSVDFLGYRIWKDHRLLRKSNVKRTRRKFKKFQKLYKNDEISLKDITPSVMSWLGHAKWADSYDLRVKIFDEFVLTH
jgi:RNA-directed DNA polymerase